MSSRRNPSPSLREAFGSRAAWAAFKAKGVDRAPRAYEKAGYPTDYAYKKARREIRQAVNIKALREPLTPKNVARIHRSVTAKARRRTVSPYLLRPRSQSSHLKAWTAIVEIAFSHLPAPIVTALMFHQSRQPTIGQIKKEGIRQTENMELGRDKFGRTSDGDRSLEEAGEIINIRVLQIIRPGLDSR